jgi:glycosyltransferase involved in cell wall biosynthesis
MASILILGVKVPFTRGGQEVLVNTLTRELKGRGHQVDTVELPYRIVDKTSLLKQAALWRSLDLDCFSGKKVDLVIATKFPSYCVEHPRKSLWLVHQERSAYELLGGRFSDFSDDPRDALIREELLSLDTVAIGECAYRSAISRNVADRLKAFNGIDAEVLYPPLPLGQRYRCEPEEPYILSVGRICTIKRVDLMIKALSSIHHDIRLKIAGLPDEPGVMEYLTNEVAARDLNRRVEFLGRVSDDDLITLYARAMMVYYAPYDEDYGYVTLEALASGKPVITAHDSGGTLEFVTHHETGIVAEPTPESIAIQVQHLIDNSALRLAVGERVKVAAASMGFLFSGWNNLIERLLSPLEG